MGLTLWQHRSLTISKVNLNTVFTPEGQSEFDRLKHLFTTAPILKLLDPSKQFIVEVDTSEVGLRVMLSQTHREPERLHPCTFFSRKLSPADRKYDIGIHELLAINVALKN